MRKSDAPQPGTVPSRSVHGRRSAPRSPAIVSPDAEVRHGPARSPQPKCRPRRDPPPSDWLHPVKPNRNINRPATQRPQNETRFLRGLYRRLLRLRREEDNLQDPDNPEPDYVTDRGRHRVKIGAPPPNRPSSLFQLTMLRFLLTPLLLHLLLNLHLLLLLLILPLLDVLPVLGAIKAQMHPRLRASPASRQMA